MNSVRFPSEQELRLWIRALIEENIEEMPLPNIDEEWYREIVSSFETTMLVPQCKENVVLAGATIFYKIIKNHRRVDGNKRSAVITIYLFFTINEAHLRKSPNSLKDFSKSVAERQDNQEIVINDVMMYFDETKNPD